MVGSCVCVCVCARVWKAYVDTLERSLLETYASFTKYLSLVSGIEVPFL